jgi:hypothetical protein
VQTGFMWLRTGTGGGLLWTWQWSIGFHKILLILEQLSRKKRRLQLVILPSKLTKKPTSCVITHTKSFLLLWVWLLYTCLTWVKQEVSKYMTYTRCDLKQLKHFLSLYHSTERQLHFQCKKNHTIATSPNFITSPGSYLSCSQKKRS